MRYPNGARSSEDDVQWAVSYTNEDPENLDYVPTPEHELTLLQLMKLSAAMELGGESEDYVVVYHKVLPPQRPMNQNIKTGLVLGFVRRLDGTH